MGTSNIRDRHLDDRDQLYRHDHQDACTGNETDENADVYLVDDDCIVIVFAFPVLTVALAMLSMDRLFGTHFFTIDGGGMPVMWANLFWIWGTSRSVSGDFARIRDSLDVITTFARKRLFGYGAMVWSMILITGLSFLVWVHHFFTMGSGPWINSVFSVTTMLIAIPTGVKIFNWLFTMHKGRIEFTTPMLWQPDSLFPPS